MYVQDTTEYLIAGNPTVSSTLLEQFALSTEERVRARVAEHRATPLEVLARLLQDESAEVRISLSTNETLPRVFLAELALDKNPDVRLGLAENPNLPRFVLEFLTNDENPYVADRAERTLMRLAA